MNSENLEVCGRMHGVSIRIVTNNGRLIEYAKEHLHHLVSSLEHDPAIEINCSWSQGEWDSEFNPFPANGELNIIGKRMLGRSEELIWLNTLRMKGLQLRFCVDKGKFKFDVAYRFHPKDHKRKNLPDYEYKKYFSLMSYIFYYPLMWYFDRTRSWIPLHASALAQDNRAVMIGGLGGVGKTTTCVALMQQGGLSLLSENIVFTDGESIYPCYEPIRLDEESLNLLGNHYQGLSPMRFPDGLKEKWLFHLDATETPDKISPAALFLPVFSPKRYMKPIEPEIAVEKIDGINRLTRELDDYGWYASALNLIWPQPGQASRRIEVLQKFARNSKCFELGIDRKAGVGAVVKDILDRLA